MSEIVDMCLRHKAFKLEFELNIDKWNTMDEDVKRLVSSEWSMVKFLNEDGSGLNSEMENLPDNKGGIYLFLLKPELIPKMHIYIMYIGRARKQNDFSLKERCKEYFRDTRPKIAYMREIWGKELYLKYLPLYDDDTIEKVERELLRVIIPPCNTQIPDYNVSILHDEPAF